MKFALSAFALVLSALSVSAATVNWIPNSGSWFVPANWSGGVVPGSGDAVVIANSGTAQASPSTSLFFANSLTLGGAGGSGGLFVNSGAFIVPTVSVGTASGAVGNLTVDNAGVSASSNFSVGPNGILTLQNGGSVSPASGKMVTVADGGVVNFGGYDLSVPTRGGGVSGGINLVGSNAVLNVNQAFETSIGSPIQGSGKIIQRGTGLTHIRTTVSNTGGIVITSGTLMIDNGAVVNCDIVNNSNLVFALGGSYPAPDPIYSGVISGTGSVTKAGEGNMYLTGDNTFTGGTTIDAGSWLTLGDDAENPGHLVAGTGGTSVTIAKGAFLVRSGSTVTGGEGASGSATGGKGGVAVALKGTSPSFSHYDGIVSGGKGGTAIGVSSATGGDGGPAVLIDSAAGASASATNQSSLVGGDGGAATASSGTAFGGNGGPAVLVNGGGTFTANQGIAKGGNGGAGSSGGGSGGVGALVTNGGYVAVYPLATIEGGFSADGARALGAQFMGGGGTLVAYGTIIGGVSMGDYTNYVALGTTARIIGGKLNMGTSTSSRLTLGGSGSGSVSAAVPDGVILYGSILMDDPEVVFTVDQDFPHVVSTSVDQGTFLANSFLAGTMSVSWVATLGGTGVIGGNATIGGTLAPGADNVGQLTFNGDLTLNSGSLTAIEIGGLATGSFDRISVNQNLTYGGTLNVSFTGGFAPQPGNAFQLFKDFDSQAGTMSIGFSDPNVTGRFDYETGTLSIVAIPEPPASAYAIAILLSALIFLRGRRKARF